VIMTVSVMTCCWRPITVSGQGSQGGVTELHPAGWGGWTRGSDAAKNSASTPHKTRRRGAGHGGGRRETGSGPSEATDLQRRIRS
jgi:hypothetical protein